MRKVIVFIVVLFFTQAALIAQSSGEYLLSRIRGASMMIPGEFPVSIRYVKFAESPRKWSDTMEGGNSDPFVQARTVFQVLFKNSFVMVDSGMDEEVHAFFGKGVKEPFFPLKKKSIDLALEQAQLILITHEHGDHVAGVIRNNDRKKIANKVVLTQSMVNTLVNKPQMPLIKLSKEESKDYIVVDFPEILPIAPGMVLIKAPGHTEGEIMIYTKLRNGQEYIFTGDVSWSYKGIQEQRLKPKSESIRIGEDTVSIAKELEWLNMLLTQTKIHLIISHDEISLKKLVENNLIKENLVLDKATLK